MEEDISSSDQVAPLHIRKAPKDEPQEGATCTTELIESPTSPLQDSYLPQLKFESFLRASYPFQPTSTHSPTTVTLELNAGDIILVHTIHTNGWADGTLLETGARGWLPTNYCEAYDYGSMRPLLKALTEFWDIIRSGDELNAILFNNHDYMRGIVAGVRFLLEKSDCLTRESKWVRQYDSIRKIRKALLADLSTLVKATKHTQQLAIGDASVDEIVDLFDDMLLKAFRVVIKAVAFFDVWSEEVATGDLPVPALQSRPGRFSAHQDIQYVDSHNTGLSTSAHDTQQSSVLSLPEERNPRKRPASDSSRRQTITHRMSYTGRRSRSANIPLASEHLNITYDAFLGVLASFLGSHMQSRSSSELLLTTQLAVKACRSLLSVVETVIEHQVDQSDDLRDAKDSMCDKIADLVDAAKQVFRPLQSSDDDVVYLPSEGMQLVNAATACVSGAGICVSKARSILEVSGDFEIEMSSSVMPSTLSSPDETKPPVIVEDLQANSQQIDGQNDNVKTRPGLAISTLGIPQAVQELETAISETSPFWTPSQSESSPILNEQNETSKGMVVQPTSLNRPYLTGIMNHTGSQSTLISSIRDSGPSFISDGSTRATSPDRSTKLAPTTPELDSFAPAESEDLSDGENEVIGQTYAHELLMNPEGRVVGGTLNAIVEKLTAPDSAPDNFFLSTVYLTFRLFTTSVDFAKALANRFHYIGQTPRTAGPVRLRVYNVLKGWLEAHWRDECDAPALPYVTEIAQALLAAVPTAGTRLMDLINTLAEKHAPPTSRVLSSLGKTTTVGYIGSDQASPSPIVSKSQLASLRAWKAGTSAIYIVDFDPLELARQITIKESNLFCSILPEELLSTEFTKQSSSLAVNVRSMAQLSTDLANLVADSILQLEEPKKRAAIVKHWIKIAKKCLELNNYDTLMAIVCSINSSTILRLKKTWDLINQKTKNAFEELKKVVDISKNYSALRQRTAAHSPPCLPFVGMYLTDLTFVDHGNSSTRQLKMGAEEISVINLDKHMKTARIISDLQRFQIPYRLAEVPELQTWLQDELIRVRAAGERNFQNHYRRSLILEPRELAHARPTTIGTMAALTGHKDKFDFLAWAQFGRDKTTSIPS